MENGSDYSALILAAGASSRMGVLKPLLRLGDDTILKRIVGLFHAAGVEDIRVVLGFKAELFIPALRELDVAWIVNADHSKGMFSSIQTGVVSLQKTCKAFFLLPGDMPFIKQETLQILLEVFEGYRGEKKAGCGDYGRKSIPGSGCICRPVYQGRHGHPPLIPMEIIPAILTFDGPGGLRALMSRYIGQCIDVPCDDPGILIDLDTPEDCGHHGVLL